MMARGGFTINLMDRQSRDTIRQVDGWMAVLVELQITEV